MPKDKETLRWLTPVRNIVPRGMSPQNTTMWTHTTMGQT